MYKYATLLEFQNIAISNETTKETDCQRSWSAVSSQQVHRLLFELVKPSTYHALPNEIRTDYRPTEPVEAASLNTLRDSLGRHVLSGCVCAARGMVARGDDCRPWPNYRPSTTLRKTITARSMHAHGVQT